MPRPAKDPAVATVQKAYRMTPLAIAAISTLRKGTESDAAVICRVLTTMAGTNPDLGLQGVVAPVSSGQIDLEGNEVLATPGGQVIGHIGPRPDRHPSAGTPAPTAARGASTGCAHDRTRLSSISNLRKCEDCGAIRGVDGVWRL